MPQNKATPVNNNLLSIRRFAAHFALFSCNFLPVFRLPARNPTLSHLSIVIFPPILPDNSPLSIQNVNSSQQLLIIHNNNTTSNHSYKITTHLYTNYTHSDHSIRAHKFSLPNTFRSSTPFSTLTQTATYKFSSHSLYSDHRIRATKNFQIPPLSH